MSEGARQFPQDSISEMRAIAARYPDPRSATLPALRLAQERHGHLTREALEEVAEALDVTPAYCLAVASFYDMYDLEPSGKHVVAVCTNLPCALVGAQQTLEAFESALGIRAGETTPDGEVTLKSFECLGGCGYAPVVAVDWRYHEPVGPEGVAKIVEELRGAG